jgi:protease-4
LPEDQLRNGLADGRVISGKDALAAKLVDQLGEIEDAYTKAVELGKAKNAAIVSYESPFKLGRLFRLLGESNAKSPKSKIEVDFGGALGPKLEAGRLYFLPDFFAQ